MSATAKTGRVTALCKIALASDGKAPSRVPLFPKPGPDGWMPARDGRLFRLSDPAPLLASYATDTVEAPIDYEHASEIKAPQGEEAPAAGWITGISLGDDGLIWADVDWTAKGQASVESREYRYISPAFALDYETREILSLVSAGLTNRPALTMPALTRVQDQESQMTPEMLKILGLDDKATPEQIETALKALKAKETEVAEVKVELQAARTAAATPALANFVPRADHDAALARVATLELAHANAEKAAHQAQVDVAIASALKSGKISPATKEFYVQTCATEAGLKAFTAFVDAAPVIAADNIASGQPPASTGVETCTADEKAIIAKMGITEAQFLAAKKTA